MTVGGGEAADQMVRMMLSGGEVAVRLSGSALKNLLALTMALAKNNQTISGKVNMTKMLRETRDVRLFSMTPEQYHTIQISLQKQNPGYNPDSYVFCQENGQPYEPRTYQDLFKRCVRQAGIPDVNFHSLRHTFATRALEQGMDVVTLSRLLGHATPSITLDKYGHALSDHKRASVEKLGGIYNAGKGTPWSRER